MATDWICGATTETCLPGMKASNLISPPLGYGGYATARRRRYRSCRQRYGLGITGKTTNSATVHRSTHCRRFVADKVLWFYTVWQSPFGRRSTGPLDRNDVFAYHPLGEERYPALDSAI